MQATESTPALTAAQRLYLDVHGYVVIENVLDEDEIAQLTETTYGFEEAHRKTGALPPEPSHYSATGEWP